LKVASARLVAAGLIALIVGGVAGWFLHADGSESGTDRDVSLWEGVRRKNVLNKSQLTRN
jgi:hypothetical protein